MKQRRGSLYLLTGLILGIGLGLLYAWVIQPNALQDSAPGNMQSSAKDSYRALIATAFISNGDLVRARARLDLLGDKNPYQSVLDQAERMAIAGETGEVTALRLLAAALSQNPTATQSE
jgi:hypothetical protein